MEETKNGKKSNIDHYLKYAIIAGILMVAYAFFYYLVLKPRAEQFAYSACLNALIASGKYNQDTIATPLGKSALDVCTKSQGAAQINTENEQRAQEELAKRAQEKIDQDNKKLDASDMLGIAIANLKLTANYEQYKLSNNASYKVKGSINNSNSFNVTNITLKFVIYDNSGKNKIDEVNCDLKDSGNAFGNSTIFYSKTSKEFTQNCILPDGQWRYNYSIEHAEKA